jgi:murein DD-endopeptidase MepM/ murein hydrolase activator NlpD
MTPGIRRSRFARRAPAPAVAAAAALALVVAVPVGAPAAASTGGTSATPPPVVRAVSCPAGCDPVEPGRPGDLVRLSGRHLTGVRAVVFLGGAGGRDDVRARPRAVHARGLLVTIPVRARSGPVAAIGADGASSRPSRAPVALGARAAGRPRPLARGGVVAQLSTRTAFFGGRRAPRLTYAVRGGARAVRVDLVRQVDGALVARWGPQHLEAGSLRTATWDGRAAGAPAPDGRYEFRVYAGAGAPAVADSFLFLGHAFPVHGAHGYGVDVNRFGPRSGRGHRGQDVLAECGTPLLAARAGRVKVRDSFGAAGNYLVVDGEGTRADYVYMHMRDPALVARGQRVATGQLVGHVGNTGNSTACHLHFELWAGPWWDGGSPVDPLPWLRAWQRGSALALAATRGR